MSRPRRLNVFKPRPRTERLGQQCELSIERLSDEGDGLAHWNGRKVFVKGALAGERVTARIDSESRHGFAASLLSVVANASDQRVEPPCRHYAECGGCQLQHLDYSAELAHKQRVAARRLVRVVPAESWLEPVAGAPWHYRHRSRLQVAVRGQKAEAGDQSLSLGFRRQGSHRVTDIEDCLQWWVPLDRVVGSLRRIIARQPHASRIDEVQLAVGEGDRVGVQFRVNKGFGAADIEGLARACSAEPWLMEVIESASGKPLWHNDQPLLAYPGHADLEFGPGDFTQANPEINACLLSDAIAWLSVDTAGHSDAGIVTEFFSGLGNFSLALGQAGWAVSGYEVVPAMVSRAADRARQLGLANVGFTVADLFEERQMATLRGQLAASHAILLDPPRAGARSLCRQIGRWTAAGECRASRLLYVSCNSLVLAGDLEPLLAAGFRVERARVYDMFPHTSHFETMVLLTRT